MLQRKRFKKYKYSRLGASQSQKLPPTDGPPTFYSNLRSWEAKKHGGELSGRMTPLNRLAHGLYSIHTHLNIQKYAYNFFMKIVNSNQI